MLCRFDTTKCFHGGETMDRVKKNMDEAVLDKTIPSDAMKILGLKACSKSKAEAFTQSFLKRSLEHQAKYDPTDVLSHKAVMLEFARCKKDAPASKHKKAKGLNARQKREKNIYQIKPEHQRYETFLPLHELWKQYITDLCCGMKSSSSPQFVQQKLLKADFHGAVLTVFRSKCPSYVGTTGILVQEFKHVFKLITKENKLKVIPKRNCVFAIEINGFTVYLYGSRLEQRASERSAKKFKVRGTIDL